MIPAVHRLRPRLAIAAALSVAATLLPAHGAGAQVVRLGRRVPTSRDLSLNTLSVSASPATLTLPLTSSGVGSSAGITLNCQWLLGVSATVKLYGFFATTNALSDNGVPQNTIPSSAVFAQVSTGVPASYAPFTQSAAAVGSPASLLLFQQQATLSVLGSRTDTLLLRVDLTALPQLPAGTYTGTLTFQAQAF